jgi:hypothetical protein
MKQFSRVQITSQEPRSFHSQYPLGMSGCTQDLGYIELPIENRSLSSSQIPNVGMSPRLDLCGSLVVRMVPPHLGAWYDWRKDQEDMQC